MSIINKIKINGIIYDIRDSSIQNKIYSDNEEPIEAKPGDIWVDMDEEGASGISNAIKSYVDAAIADAWANVARAEEASF